MNGFLNPLESAMEIIRGFLDAVASDFITSGMKYMSKYISAPTDFNKIPHFDELMLGTQAIGSTLVIVFLYLRLLGAYRDLVTEENDVNYSEIIGSSAIAMGMVWSFKPFLTKFIFPIVNELIQWIGAFKIDVTTSGQILDKVSPSGGLAMAGLHILFMAVVYGLGVFVLSIAGMIRFAHLTIAMICGPILMATYANRSGIWKSYLMSLTAVIFTQVIHMLAFALVVWTAAVGTFEMLMVSFAFTVAGITGPFVLKQWLVPSGVGGGALSIGRLLSMKLAFRR
ncbi:hypothetical protein AKG34_21345 [Peribacillus butanolivorans]|uniref:conjugal transfer protein TrbL family protein n=1 Tax=Peribacillus butanolivorans TaxID=421767 RepID=UPI0006A6EA30|nr:conjugal transfer protein TrbL family protein [Peribacillus butanolivorans]KON67367.1 hypothetical protein AKG34_21345 [Peribacillus butanolivorans]